MRWMIRWIWLCLIIFGGCASQRPQAPRPQDTPKQTTPSLKLEEIPQTPSETLIELD